MVHLTLIHSKKQERSAFAATLASVLVFLLSVHGFTETDVKLYEHVEETMTNSTSFNNPFTETELRLDVTAPSGRSLGSEFTWYGFYDGDGNGGQDGDVWKFRLLFDEPGTWSVEAGFYEPGTSTSNGPSETFSYNVSNDVVLEEHGHVYIDPDNWRRYRFADGLSWTPFSIISCYLFDQTMDNATDWIDKHASLGVNVLGFRFQAESYLYDFPAWFHYLEENTGSRCEDFCSFDYSRFDIATWRHNEAILSYAQEKDMHLYIWFGISAYNAQYKGYGPRDESGANLGPLQKLFIKYFIARFATFTNWWHWPVDVEWEETRNREDSREWHINYAKEMQRINPWKTLITVNSLGNWTMGGNEEGWDVATVQLYPGQSNVVEECRNFVEKNDDQGIPVFNSDGLFCWENKDFLNTQEAVLGGWATLMSGGTFQLAYLAGTHMMGSWGCVWGSVHQTHKDLAVALGAMTQFFNRQPGLSMNRCDPHHELVSVSGGRNALCQANPGDRYFVWLDEGGTPTVDLTGQDGTYNVSRYDCTNLDAAPEELQSIQGGARRSLPETPHSGSGRMYLYVVTDSEATTARPRGETTQAKPARNMRILRLGSHSLRVVADGSSFNAPLSVSVYDPHGRVVAERDMTKNASGDYGVSLSDYGPLGCRVIRLKHTNGNTVLKTMVLHSHE